MEREVAVDVRLLVFKGGGLEPSEVFGFGGIVPAMPMGPGRGPGPS